MLRIAHPAELSSELRSLIDYVSSPRPSRAKIEAALRDLSERVQPRTASVTLRDTQDALYRTRVKLRGYNGQPNVLSAHGKDAGDVLIQLAPNMTRAQHAQRAREFEALENDLQDQYDRALDAAAMETWGRKFEATDYRVSAIGSDEFSDRHKERLRELAHGLSAAKTIAGAHTYASKSRRIK